ncbi:MAG: hypothetical protein J0G29_07765 [Alphaproteobacteria bacterium]|nr:hypothetical protein [Alphaproteobacteria bacterium]
MIFFKKSLCYIVFTVISAILLVSHGVCNPVNDDEFITLDHFGVGGTVSDKVFTIYLPQARLSGSKPSHNNILLDLNFQNSREGFSGIMFVQDSFKDLYSSIYSQIIAAISQVFKYFTPNMLMDSTNGAGSRGGTGGGSGVEGEGGSASGGSGSGGTGGGSSGAGEGGSASGGGSGSGETGRESGATSTVVSPSALQYELVPNIGIRALMGERQINLGATRAEIRATLGQPALSTVRAVEFGMVTRRARDYYGCLVINYDKDEDARVEGIVILPPCEAIYGGSSLYQMPLPTILELIRAHDDAAIIDPEFNSILSSTIGIEIAGSDDLGDPELASYPPMFIALFVPGSDWN